ncbi:MAG: toxin-antitoxin system TumE family protein [Gammaproteobacteria bacterium]
MISNMKAEPLFRKRLVLSETAFAEIVIHRVPKPLSGCWHDFKYRLALVSGGRCVLRYDNETGKGDHKHVGGKETAYRFVGLSKLQRDFWADVKAWRNAHENRNA